MLSHSTHLAAEICSLPKHGINQLAKDHGIPFDTCYSWGLLSLFWIWYQSADIVRLTNKRPEMATVLRTFRDDRIFCGCLPTFHSFYTFQSSFIAPSVPSPARLYKVDTTSTLPYRHSPFLSGVAVKAINYEHQKNHKSQLLPAQQIYRLQLYAVYTAAEAIWAVRLRRTLFPFYPSCSQDWNSLDFVYAEKSAFRTKSRLSVR